MSVYPIGRLFRRSVSDTRLHLGWRSRETRFAPKGSHIRCFSVEDPQELFVRYSADERIKIRQQQFFIGDQPLRTRDGKGLVLTANTIDYIGAEKPDDWDDSLTGPPGKFLDT